MLRDAGLGRPRCLSPDSPTTVCLVQGWCAIMQEKYRETDALIYKPGEQAANHVSKHKQRNKALEIVFDPKDHK